MHRSLRWDDLLYILEVGRAGSLSGAARTLRVNHSTVFRRIAGIEQQLGVRLFDRTPGGYVPTSAGEAVVELAERLESDVVQLERRLAGQDLRPSGTVRVTTTDTLIDIIVPICSSFREAYPEVVVELVPGSQFLNLSRRDADVALRPSRIVPEDLFGRRIASIAFAPYASPTYVAETAGRGLDSAHRWLGYDDSLSHIEPHRWMRQHVDAERVVFRASSFLALVQGARSGMGVAILPCYMVDGDAGLQRLTPPLPELATDLWLLVHDDLRKTARVRVFVDHVARELAKLRRRIECS
jgi:DNA-binding transcriptional LysR family regulator